MPNFFKKPVLIGVLGALILTVFVGGVYVGYANRPAAEKVLSVLGKENPAVSPEVDFATFWKTWNIIESKYVSNDSLDRQKMVWGAISGLVNSLDDPYSVFFPPKESEVFQSSVNGNFEGVGMEIGIRNNILTVIAPLKGTPADRAGIKSGDKILKIDDVMTNDLTVDKAVQMIRGVKGTKVSLSVLREGKDESIQMDIVRDTIQIPVLETEKKENGIFVIRLFSFSGSSMNEFRNALREMINSNGDKLIIDLRGNPGGYLEAAVDIASWFMPLGEVVAREQFGDGSEQLYRSKGYDIFNDKLKLAILVNEGSASASEILAGALKEKRGAVLIGKKTYGKGSVQELISVNGDGSSVKLTIAKWLTPEGKSLSSEGLGPDREVELTAEDAKSNRDPQMDAAVEVLTNN